MDKGGKHMIISVDFDGTCVSHEFPYLGKNIGAEIVLRQLIKNGHDIICMTMRSSSDCGSYGVDTIKEAKNWFEENRITLYAFNDNPSQRSWSDSRKIYAHIYIDDQFLGCPLHYNKSYSNRTFVNWCGVCKLLNLKGVLSDEETEKLIDKLVEKYPDIYLK